MLKMGSNRANLPELAVYQRKGEHNSHTVYLIKPHSHCRLQRTHDTAAYDAHALQ